MSRAAGQGELLLDVSACPLPPDGPSCVWLETHAKDARLTADLAVSFCFLNSLLSLKLYLHAVRSCFWSLLVIPSASKDKDVFGPAREEFCEQRFPPAAGPMNHSMAMAAHPQTSLTWREDSCSHSPVGSQRCLSICDTMTVAPLVSLPGNKLVTFQMKVARKQSF